MKDLRLLIWLTQLGTSIVFPLCGFTWLAMWLRTRFGLGVWIVIAGVLVGVVCAVDGFRTSLKAMERMANNKEQEPLPVSFNEHE